MEVIIFDFETNWLKRTNSVLSVSAIKARFTDGILVEVWRYNRFYERNKWDTLNKDAIKLNWLDDSHIKKLRQNVNYPKFFYYDILDFENFIWDAKHFISHNISFDEQFLPFLLLNKFCTLELLKNNKLEWYNKTNKKLESFLDFCWIKFEKQKLHSSMYDTESLFKAINYLLWIKNKSLLNFFYRNNINKWTLTSKKHPKENDYIKFNKEENEYKKNKYKYTISFTSTDYLKKLQKNYPNNYYIQKMKTPELNNLFIEWWYFDLIERKGEYWKKWGIKKYKVPNKKFVENWYGYFIYQKNKEWVLYCQSYITNKWVNFLNDEIKKKT